MSLAAVWYVLVAVLLAGYAVLDGFDLGIGTLYPFISKSDQERKAMRDAIGPVWDGNEVWLLTAGGALFAAFPAVYATVFSGFYLALMLVVFSLIFRAVSLEFRAHAAAPRVWDWAFFLGSALPALLFGVAIGNIVRGVPIGVDGEYAGTFLTLLNPYSLLIGVLGLTMFVTHGAAWAALKTEGALQQRAVAVRSVAQWVFAALFVVATIATLVMVNDRPTPVLGTVVGWIMIVVVAAGLIWTRLAIARSQDGPAFVGNAVTMVGLVGLLAVGNYPALVPALDTPQRSLTIYNSASAHLTLEVMLIIAIIGVPIVLAYTALVYSKFRGKVSTETTDGGGY